MRQCSEEEEEEEKKCSFKMINYNYIEQQTRNHK